MNSGVAQGMGIDFRTCAASYVMVLVSVWTMGTSLVAISVFWAANVSEMVTISVFTTGGWARRQGVTTVTLAVSHTHTRPEEHNTHTQQDGKAWQTNQGHKHGAVHTNTHTHSAIYRANGTRLASCTA